ncbi:MAG: SBBP repeat-containing protein [Bacteroidetes bacterium]|nr:SBBP repeat-containing protein [Bacteroidota bacterium]
MKFKSLIVLLCSCILFYSFSNKNETIKVDDDTPGYVSSLVQSTNYLKLHINSPMKLAEYTANKTNKASLINSASKDVIFIPNKGQIIDTEGKLRPDILYKAELNGVALYLTNKGMSFVFYKYEDAPKNLAAGNKKTDGMHDPFKDDMKDKILKMYRMDLDIVGMNTNVRTVNNEQTEEYFNYYYAHCPEGITNVHGYGKVVYENVYSNIDLVYYSNEKGLKYDFVVKPGGNVSDIKLKYNFDDEVYITKEGKIKALNPFGEIETDVLYTYQSDGKIVESNYIKDTDGTISIITDDYDNTKDLIIDPYIGATFYSGNDFFGNDMGYSIRTDENDNILVAGITESNDFPTQNPGGGAYFQSTNGGLFDAFILKFNSNGVRQWATYYGGSDYDIVYSMVTDGNNNILLSGWTCSTNLPVQNPGGGVYYQGANAGNDDVFILKFNSNGVRQWATYYGGSDYDFHSSISIDGNNNILVTGTTHSTNLPLQNPGGGAYFQNTLFGLDAFILKFNSSGVRQWATYYGGSGYEEDCSIATDINSNILINGRTNSTDLPVQNPGGGAYFQNTYAGFEDMYILKFNSNGVRQWATYYGGNNEDIGYSIASDNNSNILITGNTKSTNLPVQNPGGGAYFQGTHGGGGANFNDVFILKFNSSGVRQWATYYGGNEKDIGHSITADNNNNILVTGETKSSNFPIHNPGGGVYYQSTNAGYQDIFILKFNSSGVRHWATYYGGEGSDLGWSINTDGNNYILVTGETISYNFPVFDPGGGAYFQSTPGYLSDVFILGFTPSGVIGINAISTNVPDNYALYQNYPNPFNPTTNVKFDIPKSSHTKLIIYDILGKEVTTLVNEKLGAGNYEVDWNGSGYTSGVYFYKLEVGDFVNVKKMLLIK